MPEVQLPDLLGLAAVVATIVVVVTALREGSTAVQQLGLVSKADL